MSVIFLASVSISSSEAMGFRNLKASSMLPPASLRPSVKIGLETASSHWARRGCRGTKHFPMGFSRLVRNKMRGDAGDTPIKNINYGHTTPLSRAALKWDNMVYHRFTISLLYRAYVTIQGRLPCKLDEIYNKTNIFT